MIAGILSQSQASDLNLATSIKQWLFSQVVTPYNAAAVAQGLNQGASLQADGSWKTDANGLGLIEALPDDKSVYERVPIVAYSLDSKSAKSPLPTGLGDGANWEWRSATICCLPAVSVSSDTTGQVVQANRAAQWLLKTYLTNAILRANTLPIVDHSQAQVGGLFPQIGYAEIKGQQIHSMERVAQMLDANKYRFDVIFDLRWAVSTTN
jgi:hypothetical protein